VNKLFKFVDSWLVPGILILTWVLMYVTSNLHGIAAVVALAAFGVVVALWAGYRELRVHAAASRHAAQGEPHELLELAERELGRRWRARRRVPFHLYRSVAHQQLGEWEESKAALGHPDLAGIHEGPRGWQVLYAAQRVALVAQSGDAKQARHLYDSELGAVAESLVAREARARVLIAEGKEAEALPILEQLRKDIRCGPAARATSRWLMSRCLDDAEARRAAVREAAHIAPKLWFALADQNAPVNARPAPPSTGSGSSDTP